MIAGSRSDDGSMFRKEWGEKFCDQDVIQYGRTSVDIRLNRSLRYRYMTLPSLLTDFFVTCRNSYRTLFTLKGLLRNLTMAVEKLQIRKSSIAYKRNLLAVLHKLDNCSTF